MHSIKRAFFWLSGAGTETLEQCPAWEQRKYVAFGATSPLRNPPFRRNHAGPKPPPSHSFFIIGWRSSLPCARLDRSGGDGILRSIALLQVAYAQSKQIPAVSAAGDLQCCTADKQLHLSS
jgi:hypothetical protein